MAEARIKVRLRPRGHRDQLMGIGDGILLARVTAPPMEGRANKALCKMIAKRIGIAPSKVSVVQGEKSRNKVVRVEGVSAMALEQALRDPDS
jgi:uncharacterized protein (TIGR00251 family)